MKQVVVISILISTLFSCTVELSKKYETENYIIRYPESWSIDISDSRVIIGSPGYFTDYIKSFASVQLSTTATYSDKISMKKVHEIKYYRKVAEEYFLSVSKFLNISLDNMEIDSSKFKGYDSYKFTVKSNAVGNEKPQSLYLLSNYYIIGSNQIVVITTVTDSGGIYQEECQKILNSLELKN